MTRLLAATLFLVTTVGYAQLPATQPVAIKGNLYVSVDDDAKIFVNGTKAHQAGIGQSKSPEIELKLGDRIVVELHNVSSPRYFMLMFVSSDKQQQVSFPRTAFKIPPDPEARDFTATQFAAFTKYAKENKARGKTNPFPYKGKSEWVWGESDDCTIASLLTREMFTPLRLE